MRRIVDGLFPEPAIRRVFMALVACQLVLVVLHVYGAIAFKVAPSGVNWTVQEFLALNEEANAPTWFSSLLLAAIGFTCFAIRWVLVRGEALVSNQRAWLLFGCLFLFLAFDETSQFHERLDWIISGTVEWPNGATPELLESADDESAFYKYLFIYVPVLGTLGLLMTRLVWRVMDRPTGQLFIAGMGCLAGKLALELTEKLWLDVMWFGHHVVTETVIVEMGLMFMGETLILTALLNHLLKVMPSTAGSA